LRWEGARGCSGSRWIGGFGEKCYRWWEMRGGGLVYRRGEASADWWRGRCRGSMA
jgi:hypothetical protein